MFTGTDFRFAVTYVGNSHNIVILVTLTMYYLMPSE